MLNYSETPCYELQTEESQAKSVRLLIKREDLNHAHVSGNKWWKLKYNLEEASRQGADTILTFGGAYSNHIYATAAAAYEQGFKCIGVLRGEERLPHNSTLGFAKEKGMHLHYISREAYRTKNEADFIQQLHDEFGPFYLIPEGGTNELALKGCAELGSKLLDEIKFDYLCLPVGTGGTMAGIVTGLNGEKEVIGFSSLKGDFLQQHVEQHIHHYSGLDYSNWHIINEYHFGGYAKVPEPLKSFIVKAEADYAVPLDPIYTAKMFFGVFDLLQKNHFRKNSTVLLLHTGGLQGRRGFNF